VPLRLEASWLEKPCFIGLPGVLPRSTLLEKGRCADALLHIGVLLPEVIPHPCPEVCAYIPAVDPDSVLLVPEEVKLIKGSETILGAIEDLRVRGGRRDFELAKPDVSIVALNDNQTVATRGRVYWLLRGCFSRLGEFPGAS
jgi:hypothetical protein